MLLLGGKQRPLTNLLDRTATMLHSKAYLHHYARHGIGALEYNASKLRSGQL